MDTILLRSFPDMQAQQMAALMQVFFAIMPLLEASELLHLPRNSSAKTRLSIEITKSIIQLITDVNTYRACMEVSCIFRKLCQRERYLDG